MVRSRRLWVSLLLAALMAVTASVVGAAPGQQGKGKGNGPKTKAWMTWSAKRVERVVAAGASDSVTVTLTSNVDVANVSLRIPGGLGRITNATVAGVAQGATFNLKANSPVNVTLTTTVPAGALESQGGVVQVLAGGRNMPASLKVLVRLPGDVDDDAADDESKPKEDKAGGQGNGKNKGKK